MKIKIEFQQKNFDVYTINNNQIKFILNDTLQDKLIERISRAIKESLDNVLLSSEKRFFEENISIVKQKFPTIPTDDNALVDLIINQPEYKKMDDRNEKV